jgi:vitamin B12 transporter
MFPAVLSRLRRALAVSLLLAPLPLLAQSVPPVEAELIVTAETQPEPRRTLGVAATVIGADEIERSKATSVADYLRTVPGLDVVQSGGGGTVTSLFLRGTNSTQALVLVDGVKLNSPFFGGADVSSLSTANLERVEVVRGPFSALWGSEAIGGVVQLFSRHEVGEKGFGGRVTGALGNGSAMQGTADVAVRTGAVTFTGGFRRATADGGLPNEFFAVTNLSGGLEVALGDGSRAGLVLRRDSGVTGIPFSDGVATPYRKTTAETTTLAIPVAVALGTKTSLEFSFLASRDRPGFSDPADPYGFTWSETDAKRVGGRLVLSHEFDANRLSVGSDFERTSVRSADSYGVPLDGETTRTFSLFVEDRLSLDSDRFVVTAGLRRDDNSAFGAAWSPRGTVVFLVSPSLKLRAAAGAAFRSPTTGELYYPFSGNPDLSPERSTSVEAGVEFGVATGLWLEMTLFRNDIRDLIQYDPQSFTNENVGRARTQGVETVLRGDLGGGFVARASYTYLDATDVDSGLPLLRRPKNRVAATVGRSFASGASAELSGTWVGSRLDRDATDFTKIVEMPAYLRVDVAATSPRFLGVLSPYVRITNLLGASYAEVSGFPAPGRRFLAGIETSF